MVELQCSYANKKYSVCKKCEKPNKDSGVFCFESPIFTYYFEHLCMDCAFELKLLHEF